MSINAADKIKIIRYLKENAMNNLSYQGMCHAIGTRGKINDVEFLEFFTDYTINEFSKNDKINIKLLSKIVLSINSFIKWINEDEVDIKEPTLDKIRNLKDFYDEYLNRTGFERDLDFNGNCLDTVIKKINELYPCNAQNESVAKYINEISALETQIKQLKKSHTEITKQYDSLQVDYTKKVEEVEGLNKEAISLRKKVKSRDKEITKLNENLETLDIRLSKSETLLSQLQEENATLIPYKEKTKQLTAEVDTLRKTIEADIKAKAEAHNLKDKQEKIEALIYQKLLLERSNIDEILKYVQDQGLVSNKDEISTLLRRLKSKINIDNSHFTITPTYKIEEPYILENSQFSISIPKDCMHYDVMLITDLHIAEFNKNVLSGFDVLTDYSVKNNINLILNLGDFYNGLGALKVDYKGATKNYKLVEQSISAIPKVDGLYHAILGGNHERNMIKYGFDPISLLALERSDILNLGYKHSTIKVQTSSTTLGQFDIHHPYDFDFPIYFDDNGIDITKMNNYLNDIYHNLSRNRNDSYIDILGHTHKTQFNYPASCYFAPPFFGANRIKEACHLRIYFDEKTQIKYMVFMPLSGTNQLIKNNEIIYQKTLKKQ